MVKSKCKSATRREQAETVVSGVLVRVHRSFRSRSVYELVQLQILCRELPTSTTSTISVTVMIEVRAVCDSHYPRVDQGGRARATT